MDITVEQQVMERSREGEQDARTRLLVVAEKLFGERGLNGTSVRDLAREANTNVAAINYYFGSKENLYLEMLRYTFRRLREQLPRYEALLRQAQIENTQEAAHEAIRIYIREYMRSMFECDVSDRHMALMAREMSDPSEALSVIVEEFIEPKVKILRSLIGQARPDLAEVQEVQLYAASIVGQCLHYRMTLPITLKLLRRKKMTPELLRRVTEHIADFSLRALAADGTQSTERA